MKQKILKKNRKAKRNRKINKNKQSAGVERTEAVSAGYVDYKKILEAIIKSARRSETIKIYYPKTENTGAGWREVEPYSFATDIGEEGEILSPGLDRIGVGHIFNGYTVGSNDDHCDSFIIGKIKNFRKTLRKFRSRNGWKIEI